VHPEAHEGFGLMLEASGTTVGPGATVLDVGGQHVNGSVHDLLGGARVTTLDLENADIVADARLWRPDRLYDIVMATEVFEHVAEWRDVLDTMRAALAPDGVLLATCASTDRPVHGATGAPLPADGEHYANVNPTDLKVALEARFSESEVHYRYPPGDAYCWARP
jgi:SAM-dependent methyltransferase